MLMRCMPVQAYKLHRMHVYHVCIPRGCSLPHKSFGALGGLRACVCVCVCVQDIIYALDDQYFAGHTHTHSDTHTTNPSPQSTNLGLAMLRDVASQYRVRVREPDGAGGMSHLAKVQAWCTAWDAWHMPHRRHQTTEQQQALDVGAA